MTDLTFDIWQFVRLMVHLEDREADGTPSALLADWRDIWEPIDQELADLLENDFDAYSDMMMGQFITVEEVTPELAREAADALAAVVTELDDLIAKAEDEDEKDALTYERGELADLRKKILKQIR